MSKQPVRTWFTADTQVRHELTARLRGFDHPDRSVAMNEHDAHIARIWANQVGEDDIVHVVGDVHVGDLDWTIQFYSALPGHKVLWSGNHDKCHPAHRGWQRNIASYSQAFEEIHERGRFQIAGITALVSHFPYEGDSSSDEPDRYQEWRFADRGKPIIHGHVHSADKVTYTTAGTPQIHVGWDAWGQLVPMQDVAQLTAQAIGR